MNNYMNNEHILPNYRAEHLAKRQCASVRTPRPSRSLLALSALSATALSLSAATVRLDELSLAPMTSGWGTARTNLPVTGTPLSVGGVKFAHGVGTHGVSECLVALDGRAQRFSAR
jgi:hypothetical protein